MEPRSLNKSDNYPEQNYLSCIVNVSYLVSLQHKKKDLNE